MKLKLENRREEVTGVRSVCRHVILRTRIEILFATSHRRGHALVLLTQLPPRLVVIVWSNLAGENSPTPLIDKIPKRQKRDLVERAVEQETDIGGRLRNGLNQPQLLEIRRRD